MSPDTVQRLTCPKGTPDSSPSLPLPTNFPHPAEFDESHALPCVLFPYDSVIVSSIRLVPVPEIERTEHSLVSQATCEEPKSAVSIDPSGLGNRSVECRS